MIRVAITEIYGGSAMMKIDGGWFQVRLLLPAEIQFTYK